MAAQSLWAVPPTKQTDTLGVQHDTDLLRARPFRPTSPASIQIWHQVKGDKSSKQVCLTLDLFLGRQEYTADSSAFNRDLNWWWVHMLPI